jgi:hypothetical protein
MHFFRAGRARKNRESHLVLVADARLPAPHQSHLAGQPSRRFGPRPLALPHRRWARVGLEHDRHPPVATPAVPCRQGLLAVRSSVTPQAAPPPPEAAPCHPRHPAPGRASFGESLGLSGVREQQNGLSRHTRCDSGGPTRSPSRVSAAAQGSSRLGCVHESAAATCDLASMAITAKDLLRLYATLAERRALPYDTGLIPTCFDYGIFLAHGGMDLPHWLTTAPHWARSAVVVGRSSALRAIKQDQQFTMAAF